MSLIEDLITEGWLKTPRIIEAFKKIKRAKGIKVEAKDIEGREIKIEAEGLPGW